MASLLQPLLCVTAPADAGRNCTGGDNGGSNELSSPEGLRKKKLATTRLSSTSNPFVKHCVKLRLSSSYRRSCGYALVVGLVPIMEVCRFQELNNEELSSIECLLILDGMESPELFNLPSTSIVHVSPHVMKKLSGVQSVDSTEAVAIMKIPRSFYDMLGEHKEAVYPSWFRFPNRILVLDGIQAGAVGGQHSNSLTSAKALRLLARRRRDRTPRSFDPDVVVRLCCFAGVSRVRLSSSLFVGAVRLCRFAGEQRLHGRPFGSLVAVRLHYFTGGGEIARVGSSTGSLLFDFASQKDPGNVGTLLRSSLAFKWDVVFLLPGCCDPFNEKALRAARGASFQIPIIYGNWLHLEALASRFQMKMLAGHPENYAEASSQISLLSAKLADSLANRPLCLVLGSEGHGLSLEALQSCELVAIPMAGMFESLNVSVAGGIFLYMLQPEKYR
ncbi:hypothetical protein IEQ34_016024 [Dendrobium chrysotoxum]|uniref:tRNA/rRNA methyltransferase SpoU type domain-containing protein n=1 Tax=Dendrobium chrysotoxum TaxID=161865 RepID=A0AAV7GEE4_DENCH|nr:hypothetical protein IEQ34_016024 [Dendrobium chrysotoxum]